MRKALVGATAPELSKIFNRKFLCFLNKANFRIDYIKNIIFLASDFYKYSL